MIELTIENPDCVNSSQVQLVLGANRRSVVKFVP